MRKYLITYADFRFKTSAERLKQEAEQLEIFDEVIIYTQESLPSFVTNQWLFNQERGGGYWIWKPYIVLDCLKRMNEDDIVLYVDSGCKLYESNEWSKYFEELNSYNGLFFQYRSCVYQPWIEWFSDKYPNLDSSKYGKAVLKNWTKKTVLDFFEPYFKNNQWKEECMFISGIFFLKKTDETLLFISEWYNIMSLNPEMVFDVLEIEKEGQAPFFVEHRHDLSLLSILILFFKEKYLFRIFPENIELRDNTQAIHAARIWGEIKNKKSFSGRFKSYIKHICLKL
jgi:hypothetical protein